MATELIFNNPQEEALYNLVLGVNPTWHEVDLDDHPDLPQFKRKLIVKGFQDFPATSFSGEKLEVFIVQEMRRKSDNSVYKIVPMKTWEIFEYNMEELFTPNGLVTAIEKVTDDETGDVVSEKVVNVRVPSINLIKAFLKTKSVHLVDIFVRFMVMYKEKFIKEINEV